MLQLEFLLLSLNLELGPLQAGLAPHAQMDKAQDRLWRGTIKSTTLRPTHLKDVVLDVADLNGFAAVPILL